MTLSKLHRNRNKARRIRAGRNERARCKSRSEPFTLERNPYPTKTYALPKRKYVGYKIRRSGSSFMVGDYHAHGKLHGTRRRP